MFKKNKKNLVKVNLLITSNKLKLNKNETSIKIMLRWATGRAAERFRELCRMWEIILKC